MSFDGIPVEFAAIADYAEVSALLEVRPGGGAFRLLAGPSAAVNVKCTLEASYQQPGGQTFSDSEDCDEAGDLETVDIRPDGRRGAGHGRFGRILDQPALHGGPHGGDHGQRR